MITMRGRVVVGVLAAVVVLGVAVALALEDGVASDRSQTNEDEGLPPFLTGAQEMPPGLANRDVLPPGLAKKLDEDATPPGLAMREGNWVPPGLAKKGEDWLPPGLAKQGKIPPGHAKRLGVDPQPGTGAEDD